MEKEKCQHGPSDMCDTDCMYQDSEPTNDEKWREWQGTNDICGICSNERAFCGGEVAHG